tara:strand:- start:2778 stop:3260 length:483 start_codon:yes stop_codon:yes gene_type:complete
MRTATKSSKLNISEEKKTKKISEILSENLKHSYILLLFGEIGVGKTTFVKHLINSLQKKYNQNITEVPSPTFNIAIEYQIDKLFIKHCDLYRVKDKKELKNLGIFESLSEQITIVEWPELIKLNYSKKSIDLFFEYNDDLNERYLTISSNNNFSFINEIK